MLTFTESYHVWLHTALSRITAAGDTNCFPGPGRGISVDLKMQEIRGQVDSSDLRGMLLVRTEDWMIVCYWGKAPQLRDSVSIGAILQLNVAHWTGFTTWTMDNELTHVSLSCFIWVKWWAVLFKLIIKRRLGDQVTCCARLWQIKTSRCGQGSKIQICRSPCKHHELNTMCKVCTNMWDLWCLCC